MKTWNCQGLVGDGDVGDVVGPFQWSSLSPHRHPEGPDDHFPALNGSGWWLTYPSEKLWIRQSGLFPIYGKSQNSCSKPPTSGSIDRQGTDLPPPQRLCASVGPCVPRRRPGARRDHRHRGAKQRPWLGKWGGKTAESYGIWMDLGWTLDHFGRFWMDFGYVGWILWSLR